MENTSQIQPVRFGSFELDLRAGELRKQGVKIKLQEQPFQILAMLLEHPGQVVTREELRSRLWPSDTFVDFDHGLNKAINKLREALGDSAENPRFIETLAKRGYRFLASLDGRREVPPMRGGPIDSIAVFPLENDSIDPDTEYLAVGIPGSIVHGLSQIPGLRVISWRTTSSEGNQQSDPLAIGRKLGARTVLIGRIWQRSNKLRLHVDLLDAANGDEIWGDQYDRSLAELFTVQDDISREVSQKLRLKLTGEDKTRLTKRYTKNIQAYQLYVRARGCVEKRSAEGFRRGAEYASQAIEVDPQFALAHAELAQSLAVPCQYCAVDPHVALSKAKASALRALELDPNLAEGHEVLAFIVQSYEWNWLAAEKGFLRAIELNPNCATAHYHYSFLLVELGRFDEAIREATEALSRDPMSPLLNAGLAFVLLLARRYDQCIEQTLTAMNVDPGMMLTYFVLGTAYEKKGLYREAIASFEKGIALGGAVALQKSFIGHAYGSSGDHAKAWEIVGELTELSKSCYVPSFTFAIVYDGLGERELAIEALQKACANRDTDLVMIKGWPHFDNTREDPRFQEIERRVGLRP
jgi:TolB-like protein/DNA-binding winged helix-turn-helix (wHTH) protein/Tfp pilus assembly protein PilF